MISGTSSGTVVEAGGVANGDTGIPTITGTLTDTDVDNTPNTFNAAAAGSATDHGYGTFQIISGGTWTYTLNNNNSAIQGLNVGQHLTDTFTVTTIDGTAQQITVTINGTNDTPILSASLTSATYTDTAADDTFAAVTGTLSSTDRDAGDSATYSIAGQVADLSLAGYTVSKASAYGTLYLNSTSGAYTFVPNDTAIEGLKTTDTTSFTLTVTDGTGGAASQTLTITLDGVNDTPVLSASLTSATYTDSAADDTFAAVTGTLSSTDRDAGDSATYSIAGQVADLSLAGYTVSKASAYGTLYLNSTSGAYTFVPNDTAIEGLKTTDTTSFTLTVTDGTGGPGGTASQTLTITLDGVNDTPVLSASLTSATYTDSAADDTFAAVTGTLSSTDRDAGDSATYSIAGQVADLSLAGYTVSKASAYGTLYLNSTSGAYTFVPNDTAIEGLKTTDTTSFTLTVTDGTGGPGGTASQTLTITLDGANDTPVLSASLTSATYTDTAADDTFAAVTGTLSSTDRDAGDSATYSIAGQVLDLSLAGFTVSKASAYGTLYLNSSSGAYTFVPNDDRDRGSQDHRQHQLHAHRHRRHRRPRRHRQPDPDHHARRRRTTPRSCRPR